MTTIHIRSPSRALALFAARVVLVGALLGPLGVAVSSTARADSKDEKFLAALGRQKITYPSREIAIANGHLVCTKLDQGETPMQVANDMVGSSGNLDEYHAGYFVGASIGTYCPKYR